MNNQSQGFWCNNNTLKLFPELYNEIANPKLHATASNEYTEIMSTWATSDSVASKSVASFSVLKPAAILGIELYNVTKDRIMKTDYVDGSDICTLQAIMSSGKKSIENGDIVETRAHFIWTNPDGTIDTADRTISNEINLNEAVEKLTVEAPRARDKTLTIVLYGRDAIAPEVADYKYPENREKNKKVKAMLPIKGSVQLDSKYIGLEIPFSGDRAPKLNMILSSGEVPPTYKKKFEDAIKFADDKKQTINFEFDTDWGDEIDVSRFSVKTIVDLHLDFTIKVEYMGMPAYITIVVTSTDDMSALNEFSSPTTEIIERISLRWGCLGKDTKILMADGTQRYISDIHIGDYVMTPNGMDTVQNILTGHEDTVIHIKTNTGKALLATVSHPIFTKRGAIRADKLNGGDILITQDGEEQIAELFEYHYNNLVYGLELKSQNQFYGEGILTGDSKLQNSMYNDEDPNWSDKAKLMQSQMKEFAEALRNQQL